ncbi:hypothetical protein GCM10023221_04440 [Luteimicrobium xylanilyticum]|uniref:Tn554 family transposase A n=1 Tax=Luteimicrobium xylanilyticum TaxID=1133546 RepID=A0A5P9Q762_9MICO|nr:site-specific integrase [Luteimicrobium xylanilyticum]QFU97263.1 Tn554 family transposase A [Luteimicrobium xylanilyticum]
MASIRKRPDGVWRARYRDDAGKEHAKHFPRKIDAQRWLDTVTASMVVGRYVDPRAGKVTFEQWWKAWSARQVWAPGTLAAAQQAADSVTFAAVRMSALRPSHVEAWVKAMSEPVKDGRKKGLEPTTIRTRVTYVRAALRAAVKDRVMASDPSKDVALPRVRRSDARMTIPTAEQVAAALGSAEPWFAPVIAVCAFAGLRIGEAAGLQLEDVNFLGRTITVARQIQGENDSTVRVVPPKYGSERVVYVPEELTTMLARYLEEFGTRGDEQRLFSSTSGTAWQRNSAGNQWRRVRRAVALEQFTLHDLRHFYASGLIAAGCDVVTVQRALGHSMPSITLNTYSHLWPTAEDRTRTAAADLMRSVLAVPADSVRTQEA